MAENFGQPERRPFVRNDDGKGDVIHYADLLYDAKVLSTNTGWSDVWTRVSRPRLLGDSSAVPVGIYWGLQEHKLFNHGGSFRTRPPISEDEFVAAWEAAAADKTGRDKYKNIEGKTDPHIATLRKTLLAFAHGSTEQEKELSVEKALRLTERRQFFKDGKPDIQLIEGAKSYAPPFGEKLGPALTLISLGAPIGNLTLEEIKQISEEKKKAEHNPWIGKPYTTERKKTPAEIQQDLLNFSQKKSGLSREAYSAAGYHGRTYLDENRQPNYATIAKHVDLIAAELRAENSRRIDKEGIQPGVLEVLTDMKSYQQALEHFGVSTKDWPSGRPATKDWPGDEFEYQWKPKQNEPLEEKVKRVMLLKGALQNEPKALARLGQLYSPEGRFNAELIPLLASNATTADLSAFHPRDSLLFHSHTALDLYTGLTHSGLNTSRVTLNHLDKVQKEINAGADAAAQVTLMVADKPSTDPRLRKLFPLEEKPSAADTSAPKAAPQPGNN